MLVLFPLTGITTSSCQPPFYVDYAKNGFTIGPFTWPSEKLTGLDNDLCHDIYTLEKENIDAILHMDRPCNATELCMFIGYVNYYCTCCRVCTYH